MATPEQPKETVVQRALRLEKEESERYAARAEQHAEKRDEWHKRWSLSLAIANAGGLVLLTSGLLTAWDKAHPPHWFFLPGLWFFAFGMLAAGGVQATMMTSFGGHYLHQDVYARSFNHGNARLVYQTEDPEDADDLASGYWVRAKFGERWSGRLLWISAAFFVAGVVIPLILLTRHIFVEPTAGRATTVTATAASAARLPNSSSK